MPFQAQRKLSPTQKWKKRKNTIESVWNQPKKPNHVLHYVWSVKRGKREKGKETGRENTSFHSLVEKKKRRRKMGWAISYPNSQNSIPQIREKSIMKMWTRNSFIISPLEYQLTIFFSCIVDNIVNSNKLSFPLFHIYLNQTKKTYIHFTLSKHRRWKKKIFWWLSNYRTKERTKEQQCDMCTRNFSQYIIIYTCLL